MTDTRYLVHGVFWDGAPPGSPAGRPSGAGPADRDSGTPVMRLQDPSGRFRELALAAGSRLGFSVAAGGKSCLGHHKVTVRPTGTTFFAGPRHRPSGEASASAAS